MKENINISVSDKNLHEEIALIKSAYQVARSNNYSFVLWRLPNSTNTQAIVSMSDSGYSPEVAFEELPEGFIFHPFDSRKEGSFLRADIIFRFENGKLDNSSESTKAVNWLKENNRNEKTSLLPKSKAAPDSKKQHSYESLVKICIDHVKRGDFEKVVPSRSKSISLPDSFDPIEAFQRLSTAYTTALISFIHTSQHGAWLGATPEVLVSVEDKSIFKTVALAGTQPFVPGMNLRNASWTQKEIEEQALVSRYIINCFKKIRLREFDEHGPKTIVAGNLMHLKTDFSVDMNETHFPQLGSVMLKLLHPTSAVCGMPLESTKTFLVKHEGYNREFYSGFLGPINIHNSSHLYVNLRCMQLFDTQAICYAGAGVTIDSIPEEEWKETEIKMNTLLRVVL